MDQRCLYGEVERTTHNKMKSGPIMRQLLPSWRVKVKKWNEGNVRKSVQKKEEKTRNVPVVDIPKPILYKREIKDIPVEKQRYMEWGLMGLPNAGKSSLLNALTGVPIAAVSRKRNTTFHGSIGILTDQDTQMTFHDMPGLQTPLLTYGRGHPKESKQHTKMALHAAASLDGLLLVVDARRGAALDSAHALLETLSFQGPMAMVLSKFKGDAQTVRRWKQSFTMPLFPWTHTASLSPLIQWTRQSAPLRPWVYPSSSISTQTKAERISETMKHVAYDVLHDELPYVMGQETLEWVDHADGIDIVHVLTFPKTSQRRMVVGKQGQVLRGMEQQASMRLSRLQGQTVRVRLLVQSPKS